MWYVLCAWGGGQNLFLLSGSISSNLLDFSYILVLIEICLTFASSPPIQVHLAKGFTSPANHTGEIPAYLLLQMRKAEAGRPQAELEIF